MLVQMFQEEEEGCLLRPGGATGEQQLGGKQGIQPRQGRGQKLVSHKRGENWHWTLRVRWVGAPQQQLSRAWSFHFIVRVNNN